MSESSKENMSKLTVTGAFVEKVLAIDFASLPLEAIEMAKQVTLDGMAVMLAGSTEPSGVGKISTAYVKEIGGTPQATVIAGGFKSSMQNAAYVNGTIGHALDFDNMEYPPNHTTSPTLPAILAIAEHNQLSGKRVIEAIVCAFEAQSRIRLAATGMEIGEQFHKPSTIGMFGATAGSAKLLGLNPEQTAMAFGIAGSRACSLSLNTGTMTKSSHAGHGARMGVECAQLAKMGWTATTDVFGPKGFFDTFMPGDSKPERLLEGFGKPYRMVNPGIGFKKYPCNNYNQRSIDAALHLREEFSISPDQIERIQIVYPPFGHTNRPQPRSGLDGKFSVQYSTLIAFLDGEVTVDSFTDERLRGADVVRMLPLVEVSEDPAIPVAFLDTYVIVHVWLRDGRHLSRRVDELTGAVGVPLTKEQLSKKYLSCTRRVLSNEGGDRMQALIDDLANLPTITEIMDIARC